MPIKAQIGGTHTFQFLDLTNSARVAAMGGKLISLIDNDANIVYHNPATLNASMNKELTLNYINYFAGIGYGYTSYSRSYKDIGNFGVGIHFVNYGKFQGADHTGIKTGNFYASEYSLNMYYSRSIDSAFTIGVAFKPIFSFLEKYFSFGVATDLGVTYQSKNKLFSAGLVTRNIGTQIIAYNANVYEPLPFEILLGTTMKLRYAPFRISLTAHQLQMPDMYFERKEENELFEFSADENNEEEKRGWMNKFTDNLEELGDRTLRHLIIGLEMPVLGDDFVLRFGYNYQRRHELKVASRVSTVGFSWGFGLRISKLYINYGRATYHLAGASNHFSIGTNLATLFNSNSVDPSVTKPINQ